MSLPPPPPTEALPPVEWRISDALVSYPEAMAAMEARVAALRVGLVGEQVWLLEHPPIYTAGTSARPDDLLDPRFPVYASGRGGQYTYHGPGQRVAYVMCDLNRRGRDVRRFVFQLEAWVIRTLALFNVLGERRAGRVGIWVDLAPYGRPGHEAKIAAIGVRVRSWISFHGLALNVDPDLTHFSGIVPCGIREHGVTSLLALGHLLTLPEVDAALMASWPEIFGPDTHAHGRLRS